MPLMSLVLRGQAIAMLTAGVSTRAVACQVNVHFTSVSRFECCLPEFGSTSNQPHNCTSRLWWKTAITLRPWWGGQACKWASLGWFLMVCAEIFQLCKQIVASAVGVADLRRSYRWRWLHVVCSFEAGWMYWQIHQKLREVYLLSA